MLNPIYWGKAVGYRVRMGIGKFFREMGLKIDRMGCNLQGDISYFVEISRHRKINSVAGFKPRTDDAWIAPSASLIGEIYIGSQSEVWYNSVLKGDVFAVRIGSFTRIGEGCTIDTCNSLPTGVPSSVNIGQNVNIGHGSSINSSIIDDDVIIHPHSVVMPGCKLQRGCVIESCSVIPPGRMIPSHQLWGGNPIQFVRDLSPEEIKSNYENSYDQIAEMKVKDDVRTAYPGEQPAHIHSDIQSRTQLYYIIHF